MGSHDMPLGAASSPSGTTYTYMQSPGSVSGAYLGGHGGGTVHMKVVGGESYHEGGQAQGLGQAQAQAQGPVYERAELPVRGWDEVELSADGRHQQGAPTHMAIGGSV